MLYKKVNYEELKGLMNAFFIKGFKSNIKFNNKEIPSFDEVDFIEFENDTALISFVNYEYSIFGDEEAGFDDFDWVNSACDIKVPSIKNTRFNFMIDGLSFEIRYAKV